jgi:hypothetical protein
LHAASIRHPLGLTAKNDREFSLRQQVESFDAGSFSRFGRRQCLCGIAMTVKNRRNFYLEQDVIKVDAEPFSALSSPLVRSFGGADEGRGSQ